MISPFKFLRGDVSNINIGEVNPNPFESIMFPTVRRVFGQLLSQDLVSVQALPTPRGLFYYLDFKYGKIKNGFKLLRG